MLMKRLVMWQGLACAKGPQCLVFIVRASGSHRRLLSRRGAGSVLGLCGGQTGNQESIEAAGMNVQREEELGPRLQGAEERTGAERDGDRWDQPGLWGSGTEGVQGLPGALD